MEQKVVQLQRRIHLQDRSYKALQDEVAGLQKELRDRERDEGRRLKTLQEEIGRLRKRAERLEEEKAALQRELAMGAAAIKDGEQRLVKDQALGSAPRWPHSDQHMDREDLIEAYYGMAETNRLLEAQLQEQQLEHQEQLEALQEELRVAREDLDEALHGTTPQREGRRPYRGMLDYDPDHEPLLIRCLITELDPTKMAAALPCLPAYILFLCIRRADDVNDARRLQSLLGAAINGIKAVLQSSHDEVLPSFWLANSLRLLHCLKQYSGDPGFMSQSSPKQREQSLRNFDLTEYREVLASLCTNIYGQLCAVAGSSLQPMVVSAVLESQTLWGPKPMAYGTRSSNMAEAEASYTLQNLIGRLEAIYRVVNEHGLDPEVILQFFRQLFYRVNAVALNHLLLRKELCSWATGLQLRFNISQLEEWLHSRKLQHSGALQALQPLIQAAQLLQLNKKSQQDAQAICSHCTALSCQQLVKLLSLYTPLDDYEERVSVAFIRTVQTTLKDRQDPAELLLDTRRCFPLQIPYNPSSVPLDAVPIPPALRLHFLVRL